MSAVPKRHKSFFDHFPAPEFMLLSTAGITITDQGVKFAELRRGMFGGQLKMVYLDQVEHAQTNLALKELSSRYGFKYTRATLPDEQAYLFTATIPRGPSKGLKDAVSFIVEENAPLSLAEALFDFEIIDQDDSSITKVAVSVLPKKVVNSYIELLEGAGIVPISFHVESQAIARAIIPLGDKRTTLIVNMGEKKTGFYVVEDGAVGFSTTLVSDASDEKGSVHEVQAELRKVFAFWNARTDKQGQPQKKIERTLLTGARALDEQLVAELMRDTPVEYALGNVWVNTDSSPRPEYFDYAAVIGLALPRTTKHHV